MVPVNYFAVLLAAAVAIVLGFLWYGPLFGKTWMDLIGFSKEKMSKEQKGNMGKSYLLMTAGTLLMSYVLAHALVFASAYLSVEGFPAGIMTGFWNWLGFIAPVTLGSVLWEGKPWKLWVLNNGYQLLSFLLMGSVLAVWE